jgi:hypothetical protein
MLQTKINPKYLKTPPILSAKLEKQVSTKNSFKMKRTAVKIISVENTFSGLF